MSEPIKILAIDDDPSRLHDLAEVLRHAMPEATVLTAATAAEGLALARDAEPDVIVLDTVMLNQADYELYHALKTEEHLREIPVCLLIAPRAERASRARALLVGADGFLVKPLNDMEIAAQLQALARSGAAGRMQRQETAQWTARSTALQEEVDAQQRIANGLRRELGAQQQMDEALRGELRDHRQIEAALHRSMAILEGIYRAAPVGIGMAVGRVFVEVNETLCRMTGYTRAELIGRNTRVLYPTDEDYAYVGREHYRQIAEHGAGAIETRWQHKDGRIMDIWLSSAALDPTDMTRGIVFTALDITERKRDETARREQERRLAHQKEVLLRLMRRGTLFRGDLSAALAEITEAGAELLGTERVSVWSYNEDYSVIHCLELYERSTGRHSSGEELRSADFPRYAQSHRRGEIIVATDVRADPRTNEIPAAYWDAHNIYSLMDAPVWLHDKVGGLISFEQVGAPRAWTLDDEQTVATMAALVSLCFEAAERVQAENALANERTLLRTLIDHLPDAVFAKDLAGRKTLANPAELRRMGFSAEAEALGKTDFEVYPAEQAAVFYASDQQIFRTGEPILDHEQQVTLPDGHQIWQSVSKVPLRDSTGQIVGLIGIGHDITERKRAELALRMSERRFRDLFQNMPACCFTYDRNGVIQDWNHACEVLYGWTAEQAIGKSMFDLFVQEKNVALTQRNLAAVFQGQMIEGAEFEDRRADGSVCTVLANEYPLWNSEGQIEAGICVELDITERKRMEEALRQEKDRAQRYLDTAAVMMLALDVEGKITLVNKKTCEVLGYRAEELIGADWFATCLPVADQQATRHYFMELLSSHAAIPTYHENPVMTRTGEERWIAWHNTVLTDESGRIVGILSSGEDITERRRMEDQLRATLVALQRANADLERFSYVAAHDLQEPLRMVASYAQLLGMRYRGKLDADADDFIDYMVEGASRMQQLLFDLMEYARAGLMEPQLRPTDADLVLRTALRNLELAIVERGALIESEPLPLVWADPGQLTHVFEHLISNAIKFCENRPPHVRISARPAPPNGASSAPGTRFWEFAVQDNGIGIEPQYYERIFVAFQRLHGRQRYAGSGLGLSLCKRIIERHGGRMWVASTPGQGSTFYFTLPAADAAAGEVL
ncbi:MAG: PAS domain S-box protein [Anaerolineae bacterium]|nr:PAS domain S-box protein [Anaerolineae bacterium]